MCQTARAPIFDTTRLAALVERHDVPGPRYTSYPTADTWGPLAPGAHTAALARAAATPDAPLSLYVHLPFCRSLCLYCGCNVVVAREPSAADRYLDALEREMDLVAARLGDRRTVAELHWGGGTPTFLDEPRLARLHRAIISRFTLAPNAALAVEIDPRVTSHEQLELLRLLGFNRISMGVQDFDPAVQQAIGREQGAGLTGDLLAAARILDFTEVNFDLVYGLPRQTRERWRRTLETVVQLGPDRIATYSFAYVPHVRRQQRRLPQAEMATGAAKLELLLEAHDVLGKAGYQPIGMDHFARAGSALAEAYAHGTLHRNFQGYTVKAAKDVVAFGVTAISDLGGELFAQNVRDLPSYYRRLEAKELPTARGIELDDDDRRRRALITRLMCDLRVELLPEERAYFATELAALPPLVRDGLVERSESGFALTPTGRLFARNVAMVFDARRSGEGGGRVSQTV